MLNISLTTKESVSIEKGTQYPNHETNNAIKNQIYPKISHKTFSAILDMRNQQLC